MTGQAHILREAFAPTDGVAVQATNALHQTPANTAPETMSAIHVLLVGMDGGAVSREDRVRVRVFLAADSDDWEGDERFGSGSSLETTGVAVSGVGVVDEEAAICRWGLHGVANGAVSSKSLKPKGEYKIIITAIEVSLRAFSSCI